MPGPATPPDLGIAPGAGHGRGARRAALAGQRHELCFAQVTGIRASASLCCALLCTTLFFGLGSGKETASMAMYLLPSIGGCLHQYAI